MKVHMIMNFIKTLITSYQVSNFLSKDQSFMISIFKSEWDAENKIWRTKKLSPISKFKNFVKKFWCPS